MGTAWFSVPLFYIATLFTIGLTVRWCYKRRHRSWYSGHAEQDVSLTTKKTPPFAPPHPLTISQSLAKRAKRTCRSFIPPQEVLITLLIICVLCAGVMLKFRKTDMADGFPVGTNGSAWAARMLAIGREMEEEGGP